MGRNWQWSVEHGREQRLKREREAAEQGIAESDVDRAVPLHSHDGTMQSQFAKGWHSVTARDIYQVRHPQLGAISANQPKVAGHIARLRELFKETHP
jgi:hypothetical protein